MKQIILLASLLTGHYTNAQYYFYNDSYFDPRVLLEAGVSAGAMNCFTDLGGNKGPGKAFIKDMNLINSRICGGVYLHALYNYIWGYRLEFTAGGLRASDSILKNDKSIAIYRYKRNLHFRSSIVEISAIFEWHFLSQINQRTKDMVPVASPYLLGGLGIFHFNPEAYVDNHWVSLQPLHTEGQGFKEYPLRLPYKLTQFNLPIGAGVRYELSALLNLRLEIVHRVLFTDYLDDVSTLYIEPFLFDKYLNSQQAALAQKIADRRAELGASPSYLPRQLRGDPSDKDAYLSINLKLGMVLNRPRR